MPIYKPSELKAFLETLGVRPNKKLSQNFLIDGNVLDKIVALAKVEPGDLVIEIGPGPGALTEKLLSCGCHVIAIEKDPVYADALARFGTDHLKVYCQDARDFPYEKIQGKRAKVVANLPYNVTTPLLEQLVTLQNTISSCTVMLQEDAARRFLDERGYFSLFLNYYAVLQRGFQVSSGSFFPKPTVSSRVINLTLQKRALVQDEPLFFKMLHEAFIHKRKMLKSSLKEYAAVDLIEAALIPIKKSPCARPEELHLDEWVQFFISIQESSF